MFSRATRGAVQALRVLLKLQWSSMVLGGPKDCTRLSALGCCSMVLALSSTISWSKVDYYYGVPVPHEGYTGFQGTVHWTLSGSRGAVQALRVLFNGINECC